MKMIDELLILNIDNPCLEVQLEAVKNYPLSIEYIKNPCLEIQLEVVKRYESAICYIENPCKEVQDDTAGDLWGQGFNWIDV